MVLVGQPNSDLFQSLLRTKNEQAVLKFRDLGADLLAPSSHSDGPLTILTRWCYADLLAQVCLEATVMDKRLESAAGSKQRRSAKSMCPPLQTACERELPNLEVIKVLVEKINLDVNAITTTSHGSASTALHILAQSSHLWQAGALEYLIDHGASLSVKALTGIRPCTLLLEKERERLHASRFAVAQM